MNIDIHHHSWEDGVINRIQTYPKEYPTVTLWFKENTGGVILDEKDVIALAKHFGCYKEPNKITST